jgi:exodeoxyribonuclease-5
MTDTPTYQLSGDQAAALQAIGTWYKGKTAPYLTLGGYAGTGKTTLIAYLRKALQDYEEKTAVAFCAFTGKAARVLDDRLKEHNVMRGGDNVSTIHSLIYTAQLDDHGAVASWQLKEKIDYDLIVVDEASMIDEGIWNDLLTFNVPILAVGDHGQLPPVGSSFNLMADPQLRLDRIFRQEVGSAIIEVATLARMNGFIPVGEYGSGVRKLDRRDEETNLVVQDLLENYNNDTLLLCGYNTTRHKLNQAVRQYRDVESPLPQSGDRVVCLRNNRTSKVYNGMTGTINNLMDALDDPEHLFWMAEIALDNEDYRYYGHILRSTFGAQPPEGRLPLAPDTTPPDLFDFGYALTVHKAQGSQSSKVVVFEERFSKMSDDDYKRWLYTAVTRAEHELIIIGSGT